MEQEKKKVNKTLIIINVVALVIILSVAGFFVYDKYFKKSRGMEGPGFGDMNIEDICKNFQNRPDDTNRTPPEGTENMQERMQLIQTICADGTVTAEEKQQYEDSLDK